MSVAAGLLFVFTAEITLASPVAMTVGDVTNSTVIDDWVPENIMGKRSVLERDEAKSILTGLQGCLQTARKSYILDIRSLVSESLTI